MDLSKEINFKKYLWLPLLFNHCN